MTFASILSSYYPYCHYLDIRNLVVFSKWLQGYYFASNQSWSCSQFLSQVSSQLQNSVTINPDYVWIGKEYIFDLRNPTHAPDWRELLLCVIGMCAKNFRLLQCCVAKVSAFPACFLCEKTTIVASNGQLRVKSIWEGVELKNKMPFSEGNDSCNKKLV